MYPFGSGYPPNNQAPYPGAYPPSNQAPYPSNNPFPNAPFGAGYPAQPQTGYPPQNQPGYPPAGGGYPPAPGGAYPPAAGGAYPPNPSQPAYGGSAYPPQPGQMPSAYPPSGQAGGAYPPAAGTGYPPQTQPGYPPAQPGYPPAQPSYPPSQQSAYPPSQQPAYPSQPGYMPSSTNPQYPAGQTASPYPNLGNQGGAPYPGQAPASAVNMAHCFTEMKSQTQASSPVRKGTPTVVPANPFDPVSDANALRKAMKGFGTDEATLINILCKRTNSQRLQIAKEFKTNFGKDLIEDIKSETSGNFELLLVALLTPIVEYYVMQLHASMSGAGTDEDVLIETLCTLSNYEIETIKNAYHYRYAMPLENNLRSETSGHFERLLVALCAAGRDESGVADMQTAQNDAQQLLQAGVGRMGTDEATFNLILCRRNYQQLKLVFQEYEKIAGHTIETAIKKEFSGDIEDGLLSIARCATNRPEYFARRLHRAMAGFGTNDNQLMRLLVTRCEVDLQDIKVAFEQKYGKSLKSWIKGEASGHYKNCLLALIGEEK